MLGNFSFGDYFKRDAIRYGWEWVTAEAYLGIDPDRIFVTVHNTDDEAAKLWCGETGIADNRVYRLGDKDNFWQMGDTGPCGPCSEIFIDLRAGTERGKAGMSVEEFQTCWFETHGPIAGAIPGLRRYVQCHTLPEF